MFGKKRINYQDLIDVEIKTVKVIQSITESKQIPIAQNYIVLVLNYIKYNLKLNGYVDIKTEFSNMKLISNYSTKFGALLNTKKNKLKNEEILQDN